MDELPQWTDIGGPPSPKKLVQIKGAGLKLYICNFNSCDSDQCTLE